MTAILEAVKLPGGPVQTPTKIPLVTNFHEEDWSRLCAASPSAFSAEGTPILAVELGRCVASKITMHFVHDWLRSPKGAPKHYSGFAREVVKDCFSDDYLDYALKRKEKRTLSFGKFFVTCGRNLGTVINIVSSETTCLADLRIVLGALGTITDRRFYIHLPAVGNGRWRRAITEVLQVFLEFDTSAYPHRFLMFIDTKPDYDEAAKYMHKHGRDFLGDHRRANDEALYDQWADAPGEARILQTYNPKRELDLTQPKNIKRNAIREQLEFWRVKELVARDRYNWVFRSLREAQGGFSRDTEKCLKLSRQNFGIMNAETFMFEVSPMNPKVYECAFDGVQFVDLDKLRSGQVVAASRWLLVGDETVMMQDGRLYAKTLAINPAAADAIECEITQGVPGCGKTHYILEKCSLPDGHDVVLFTTREGSMDFRERYAQKHFNMRFDHLPQDQQGMLRRRARTIHSLILSSESVQAKRLIVDEAFMAHAGEILIAAILTGVESVVMLGDVKQIPYINRIPQADVRFAHAVDFARVREVLSVSYRCTLTASALLSELYEGGMKTVSTVSREMRRVHYNNLNSIEVPPGAIVLTFKQSEKAECLKRGLTTYTIHEFQGKQAADIVVVRMSTNAEQIYQSDEHCLVAISRHTRSFCYYSPDVRDKISMWVAKANTFSEVLFDLVHQKRTFGGPSILTPFLASSNPQLSRSEALQRDLSGKTNVLIYAPPAYGKTTFVELLRREYPYVKIFDTDDYIPGDNVNLFSYNIMITNDPDLFRFGKFTYAYVPRKEVFDAGCAYRGLSVGDSWHAGAVRAAKSATKIYTEGEPIELKSSILCGGVLKRLIEINPLSEVMSTTSTLHHVR